MEKLVVQYLLLFLAVPGTWTYNPGDLIVVKSLSDIRTGGRLEVFYSDSLIPFCITNFNAKAAKLACYQLGFSYVLKYGRVNDLGFGPGDGYGSRSIDSLTCPVNAKYLKSCFITLTTYCSGGDNVGIICTNTRGHSSVSTTVGVFFGILFFLIASAVVAAVIIYMWRKKHMPRRNIVHQLLKDDDNQEGTPERQDQEVNESQEPGDNNENVDQGENENRTHCTVFLSKMDDSVVTPTAPIHYPPRYSEIDTTRNAMV